jgi:hypothetical protein
VQNYKKKVKNAGAVANFSLFTFHFSLFFVPLQPLIGKSGAFEDVKRL